MKYHLKNTQGTQLTKALEVAAISELLKQAKISGIWFATSNIGETDARIACSSAEDWFPLARVVGVDTKLVAEAELRAMAPLPAEVPLINLESGPASLETAEAEKQASKWIGVSLIGIIVSGGIYLTVLISGALEMQKTVPLASVGGFCLSLLAAAWTCLAGHYARTTQLFGMFMATLPFIPFVNSFQLIKVCFLIAPLIALLGISLDYFIMGMKVIKRK